MHTSSNHLPKDQCGKYSEKSLCKQFYGSQEAFKASPGIQFQCMTAIYCPALCCAGLPPNTHARLDSRGNTGREKGGMHAMPGIEKQLSTLPASHSSTLICFVSWSLWLKICVLNIKQRQQLQWENLKLYGRVVARRDWNFNKKLKLPGKTMGFEAGLSHSSDNDKSIHCIFIYSHFVRIVICSYPEDSRDNGGILFKKNKILA